MYPRWMNLRPAYYANLVYDLASSKVYHRGRGPQVRQGHYLMHLFSLEATLSLLQLQARIGGMARSGVLTTHYLS